MRKCGDSKSLYSVAMLPFVSLSRKNLEMQNPCPEGCKGQSTTLEMFLKNNPVD